MTAQILTPTRAYDPVSISPLEFWSKNAEEREKSFKILRDERPISWHPPLEGALMPPENDGVWAVTRHEHLVEASKAPHLFTSAQGIQIEEVPDDILEAASSFLAMDGERHFRLRRLISSAFTPKQLTKIQSKIVDHSRLIIDDMIAVGEGDFVEQVSKRLPMWTIYEMMGLPLDRHDEGAHHADGMVAWADEDVAAGREPGEVLSESLVTLLQMGMELAEQRRANPQSDLMTNLVNAEIDGEKLTDEEIGSFFVLLSVAGNDTTRNSISLTTKALTDFPEQKALLLEDFDGRIGGAIEEFVRWATPVMTFRRTVTQDTVLGGQEMKEGEWIVMVYSSANRDDRVFTDPGKFDILRYPNPHIAFGAGGPHFCMGNMLARMQLRTIFDQLLHRVPTLELGDANYLTGNFVHAVKSMPFRIG